jgi:hypothetical protein
MSAPIAKLFADGGSGQIRAEAWHHGERSAHVDAVAFNDDEGVCHLSVTGDGLRVCVSTLKVDDLERIGQACAVVVAEWRRLNAEGERMAREARGGALIDQARGEVLP